MRRFDLAQQQRGFIKDEIEQLLIVGEKLDEQAMFVTRRAAAERIRVLKAQTQQFWRISGEMVVFAGDGLPD